MPVWPVVGSHVNYPILSLRVVQFNDETLAEPIVVEFGPAGGTIGRASECTLVLPDQQRAISRVHARIEFRAGEYLLCDLGSNPSVLNQRALGGTREARLTNGDRLVVGTYLLDVSIGERAAGVRSLTGGQDPLAAAQVLGGPLPVGQQGDVLRMGSLDPLGQPGFGEQQRISTRPGYAGSESDHVSPELQAFSVPQPAQPERGGTAPPAVGIPAGYDPLADALAQWETPMQGHAQHALAPPQAPYEASYEAPYERPALPPGGTAAQQGGPTGLSAGLLGEVPAGGAATPFDDLFARPTAPAPPAARPVMPEVMPALRPEPKPVLPVAPPRAEAAAARPPAAALGEPVQPASWPARQATPSREAASTPAGADAVCQALLDGLGLDASRAPSLPETDFARLIGEMLRESLRGTMAVLRARSMTKREARLDTTMIVARDNNPLKFFPDVDSALAQMLSGRGAGYLPPDEALRRAFNDIEAHELAVIAGMRAALAHVLGRFDPASIEAQLKEPGTLAKVLSNRKAKLWDVFVDVQGAITREADDDFQKLFGKAFNDAYEAQIEALHAARERRPADPGNPA